MRYTQDDRGESYWDAVPPLPGQVNVSMTRPGQKRGFHLHREKTDYWLVIAGQLRVVFADDGTDDWQVTTLSPGDAITFLPGVWHAYQNISDVPAMMIYYETAKSGPGRHDDAERPASDYPEWPR